jgi:hypothetical protein
MGEHEISIKPLFDFRTPLPINEILYIQYINGKRKKVTGTKVTKQVGKKVTRKSHRKKSDNIFFPHLQYSGKSQYV